MISKKEEQIYNSHLHTSRVIVKGKPVKLRRNFDNLDDKDVVILKKLSKFFDNYNHINYTDWFIAPYRVYSGCDHYFGLHFYTTRKALKCYTLYIKQRETQNPDSDSTIEHMKGCLRFLYSYCVDNNLTLEEYVASMTGNLPTVLIHLKEHKITFYMLHLLEVDAIIKTVESQILNFIVNNFWNTYSQTRIKFANSQKLKHKTRQAKEKITKKLIEKKTN